MMPVEQVEDFRGTPSFYGMLPRMAFLFHKGRNNILFETTFHNALPLLQ